MAQEGQSFLTDIWYHAMPGADIAAGGMAKCEITGQPVLFLRDKDGMVSAIRDVCPHRGIPLSYGKFDGCSVECCYHGWKFATNGTCTEIPALTGDEKIAVDKIRVRSWPVVERQGQIWIFMGDAEKASAADVPLLPGIGARGPRVTIRDDFPCHVDHAVVGLMDPAHGPFVHQSWWWRKPSSIHEKAKKFGPSKWGFTMLKHRPSKNSAAYRILGGTPETEIAFRLPGVRIEHISVGRHHVVNFTAVTPVNETMTRVTNSIYWTQGYMTVLAPLIRLFAKTFLGQDKNVVVMQQEGLKHEKNLLLIRDADVQARWYYQIKNEYQRAQDEGRDFENPVKETVLKWRS